MSAKGSDMSVDWGAARNVHHSSYMGCGLLFLNHR